MKTFCLPILVSLVCLGGEPVVSEYSVLVISSEVVTSNGSIDLKKWEKWDFQHPAHISIGKGIERMEYLPVGDKYFSLIGPAGRPNAVNEELSRRFEQTIAKNDLSTIKGRVHYQGRMLKYPCKVIKGPAMWGSTIWGEGPRGFRFREFLIFMVQARPFTSEDCFDFVLYNLKNNSYANRRTFGAWPNIWMFRDDDAMPDQRPKATNP